MAGSVLAAIHGPSAFWYLTRGTGIVALVLLSLVLVLGIAASMGWTSHRWPRFFSQALHRYLSLFCLVLIAVHVLTTVIDGFAPIGFLDAVVPFRSPYRPLWLGLGALAFDLFIVLGITSALRQRIGYRLWKALHWLAYLCWPLAVLHGLGTGTDTRLGPVLAIDAVCVAAVIGTLAWRLAAGWRGHVGARLLGGTTASIFSLAVALFVVLGPLRPDWSRRAGTPSSSLLGSSPAATATGTSQTRQDPGKAIQPSAKSRAAQPLPSVPFTASVAGSFTVSHPDASGLVTVDIRGQLSAGANLPFELVLRGPPAGGGVAMTSSQVTLGTLHGVVVALNGDRVVAVVGSGGSSVRLSMQLSLDQARGAVQGVARGGPDQSSSSDGDGSNQ